MAEVPLVLVADDDESILYFVATALAEEGCRVVSARHGREALERLGDQRPSLVIVDMAMPVMDGEHFLRVARSEGLLKAPVVIMTAASRARIKCQELGADGYLAKPFGLRELHRCVEALLAKG